jgi:hypothetical protein
MEITESRDLVTGDTIYTVRISRDEFVSTTFYPFDRALFEDCAGDDATVADRLLALELIARRVEESKSKPVPTKATEALKREVTLGD